MPESVTDHGNEELWGRCFQINVGMPFDIDLYVVLEGGNNMEDEVMIERAKQAANDIAELLDSRP